MISRQQNNHQNWDWPAKRPVVRLCFDSDYHNPDETDRQIKVRLIDALNQIRERACVDKNRGRSKTVQLIAFAFGREARNLVGLMLKQCDYSNETVDLFHERRLN